MPKPFAQRFTFAECAAQLGITTQALRTALRTLNILDNADYPFQFYIDKGYFICRENSYTHPVVGQKLYVKTRITYEGFHFIKKQLENAACTPSKSNSKPNHDKTMPAQRKPLPDAAQASRYCAMPFMLH